MYLAEKQNYMHETIKKIELRNLQIDDYKELKNSEFLSEKSKQIIKTKQNGNLPGIMVDKTHFGETSNQNQKKE